MLCVYDNKSYDLENSNVVYVFVVVVVVFSLSGEFHYPRILVGNKQCDFLVWVLAALIS